MQNSLEKVVQVSKDPGRGQRQERGCSRLLLPLWEHLGATGGYAGEGSSHLPCGWTALCAELCTAPSR